MTTPPTTHHPDLGSIIALAASVSSPAAIHAEPMRHGLAAVEALVRLLRSAGYSDRVTEPLVEWVIENTPRDQIAATAERLGIVLAEIA